MTAEQKQAIWIGVFTSAIGSVAHSSRDQSSDYMDMEFIVLEAAKTANRTIQSIENPRRVNTAEEIGKGLGWTDEEIARRLR